MGYKRNPKVYKLVFGDDTDYAGLEVEARSLSMGQVIAWRNSDENTDSVTEMVELLAKRIVRWNLEDEKTGEPVPLTLDAIKAEDRDMVMEILSQWTNAIFGVAAPLENDSASGETSPAESLLTEVPSESLAS